MALKYGVKIGKIKDWFAFLIIYIVTCDVIYCGISEDQLHEVNTSREMSTEVPYYYNDYHLYEDYKLGSDHCQDKYKCSEDRKSFPEKLCHCDKLCGLMHDCCDNYHYKPVSYLAKEQFECVPLYEIIRNENYGVYMVTKCSSSWDNYQTKSMCEGDAKVNNNLLRLPVSDKTEYHVMFKNIYCAVCNFITEFYFWVQAVKCRTKINERALPDMKNCSLFYYRPKPNISHRTCQISQPIVSFCNITAEQGLIIEEETCKEGVYAVTYDTSGMTYRNKYCAMCNGVAEEAIYCEHFYLDPSRSTPDSGPNIPYSFRRILDTNTCQISQDDKQETMTKCSDNEVLVIAYDFSEECVEMTGTSHDGCKVKVTPFQAEIVFHSDQVERYLTLIGLILSIVSLALTLIVYISFPKLRNTPGKILISLVISLLFAQILYLFAAEVEHFHFLCILVGITIHFFFLAAFCWMNVIAFDLCMTFSRRTLIMAESENKGTNRFVIYSVYAWLLPCIIVCVAVVLDFEGSATQLSNFKPEYGNGICWISSRNALILFFAGPFAVFKIFDIIAFIATSCVIARTQKQGAMARSNKQKCFFVINIKLSVIMGLTWIFAFLGNFTTEASMWYMFIIFNSLQGLFIAICFICKKKIGRLIRERYKRVRSKDPSGAERDTVRGE